MPAAKEAGPATGERRRLRITLRVVAVCVIGPLALFALGLWWPCPQAPLPDAVDSRLIVNARIIDVRLGSAGAPTHVLIERGQIVQIGPGVKASAGIPVFNAAGGYLLPGFWDMHTHAFQLSPQLHFPLSVANGVTGTRDMMDCPQHQDSLIACVADKRHWTRLTATGRMTAPRFVEVASFYFEDPAMTPAQAAARAAAYRARGVDALKVYNRMAPATYLQLATEARRLGMPLVGHLPKAVSLDQALQQGQRSFEHAHLLTRHCFSDAAHWRSGALDRLDPVELAEHMVAGYDAAACQHGIDAMRVAGSWWVPTHVTREEDARATDPAFLADPRLVYLDPLSRWAYADDLAATAARYPGPRGQAALRGYFDHGLALTAAAYRAGVPVLVGTDTAIGGFRFHDEMALLVRAGLSPAEVLRAATLDAARYAGKEAHHGSVEVGKLGDLVLLDANPLEDIAHTRRIQAVFMGGRLHDRKRLDDLLAFGRGQARSPAVWTKLVWGFVRSPVSAEL
ncbi:amidohydrolase family protein [Stenotrophomonas rhizophila]|uniref:amidohydrolase family protein n=1 Tax=Stenotrophomonas rhizophila TaxID=216778 RepID=UPI001E59252B|nr:amidohydrolase family protein [Stenotrophomonas rhizophila]MCC7635852.1 amidohydrolase family protein [Stenotrophomonas rhizophila]MCC7662676.1 amidohydrolase family protein [Stenotrophomonas rhizophila]